MTTRAIIGGEMATSGSKIFLTGAEEVVQNIVTRLKWFYGEAFLDSYNGTPWFQSILGKPDGQEREAALKKIILETAGVAKLTSFQLTEEGDSLQLAASVLTIYSAEAISFEVTQ